MPESQKTKNAQAREVLERAFPGRKVVQVDVLPLIYDGGGLHCHSRNQPVAAKTQ
jgi:agmatine deiminase